MTIILKDGFKKKKKNSKGREAREGKERALRKNGMSYKEASKSPKSSARSPR